MNPKKQNDKHDRRWKTRVTWKTWKAPTAEVFWGTCRPTPPNPIYPGMRAPLPFHKTRTGETLNFLWTPPLSILEMTTSLQNVKGLCYNTAREGS